MVGWEEGFDKVFGVVFFGGFGFVEEEGGREWMGGVNVGVMKRVNVVGDFVEL